MPARRSAKASPAPSPSPAADMHEQLGVTRPAWLQKGYTPTPKKKPQQQQRRSTTRSPSPSPSPASSGSLGAGPKTTDVPGALLLGAIPNLFLLNHLLTLQPQAGRELMVTAAQVYVAVNCFRCCFPNRYSGNVVLHDTPLSSILLTRSLATFSEMAHLCTLAAVALDMNAGGRREEWIQIGAQALPFLCAAAQCLVWSSLLLETESLMWWEEALWAAMFVLNTSINASFYAAGQSGALVTLSLVFGVLYLPWQCGLHLPSIPCPKGPPALGEVTWERIKRGAAKAAFTMDPTKDAEKWGGAVGAVWMISYWILMPWWMALIADAYADGSPSVVQQLLTTLGLQSTSGAGMR